jgi:hypothetical protein
MVGLLALAGCAKASSEVPPMVDASPYDASCGQMCDHDHDGVFDPMDKCPDTPAGVPVNKVGCADSQLTPTLSTTFPPFGLLWTNAGSIGRPGGLTWTYSGITRGDVFHIYWVICDDPMTPCGLSLDGPIDAPGEAWTFSATDSDLTMGKLVFTNTTGIALDNMTTTPLTGRLTVTIVDGMAAPLPAATVATLGVPPQKAGYGAEIPKTDFTVTTLIEVQDATAMTWTPYLDYYDAAPTPMAGGATTVSFGGSFYSK